jgi:hypothetical protein
MLQRRSKSLVRGERPTRADPPSVRKSASALWQVTGHGERTSFAPRGVGTKWSDADERFRSRLVAVRCGAPVQALRVAWGRKPSLSEYRWVRPAVPGGVYRDRSARQQPTMTAGTSDAVRAGASSEVRGRYKQSEIRPSCGGGHGGLYRAFTDISISRLRSDGGCAPLWSAALELPSTPRGGTVVEA